MLSSTCGWWLWHWTVCWVCVRFGAIKAHSRGLINGGAYQREVGRASGKRPLGDLVWWSVEHLGNRLSLSGQVGRRPLRPFRETEGLKRL